MAVSLDDLLAALDAGRTETLAALDARGFLFRNDDTVESFRTRLLRMREGASGLQQELTTASSVKLFDTFVVQAEDAIPSAIMQEAARTTWGLYRFSVDWVPGFFLRRGIGWLWGGCAVTDPETGFTIFLVRHSFAASPRWFIYQREELLSHELCHVARMALDDSAYEEHFAYATAHSRLRRYIGNWFQSKYDAVWFLLPVLLLLAAETVRTFTMLEYQIWPFWLLALAYPLFLLVRNHLQRRKFFQAFRVLLLAGCRCPAAMLFRCVGEEIAELAGWTGRDSATILESLRAKATGSLKWQVMIYRFIDNADSSNLSADSDNSGEEDGCT